MYIPSRDACVVPSVDEVVVLDWAVTVEESAARKLSHLQGVWPMRMPADDHQVNLNVRLLCSSIEAAEVPRNRSNRIQPSHC